MSDIKTIGELTPHQFAFMLGKELNAKAASAEIQRKRIRKVEAELAHMKVDRNKHKKAAHDATRDRNKAVRELRELQVEAATLKQHNDELIWAREE